jgi:hypothetical protein
MVAVISLLGRSVRSAEVEALFATLGTYRRPELSGADGHDYYDWVLVARKGLELGFVDSHYHRGDPRETWRHGELQLAQLYFYSGFDDIRPYVGELPFALAWADSREHVRNKLSAHEGTRHSYLTDTWDVPGYRLTVAYRDQDRAIDRIACRLPPLPLVGINAGAAPHISAIVDAFGETARARQFVELWSPRLTDADIEAANENGAIDLTRQLGATLGFAASAQGPVFRSITLHRVRDMESVGWRGALPHGLAFEDDPSALFQKITGRTGLAPVQHADSALTGHAVWHFDDHTLHVLYSHLDNRLLRVKLIAPGTWKCIED